MQLTVLDDIEYGILEVLAYSGKAPVITVTKNDVLVPVCHTRF